jgi:hypothetical protein
MQSTMVQQGPGDEPGDCLSTLHLYSDAGCADLPLTLLGAPVSIRGDLGHGLSESESESESDVANLKTEFTFKVPSHRGVLFTTPVPQGWCGRPHKSSPPG